MKILPPNFGGMTPPGNSRVRDIPENPPGLKIRDFPRTEKYGFRRIWGEFHILQGSTRKCPLGGSRKISRVWKSVIFLAQKHIVLTNLAEDITFTRNIQKSLILRFQLYTTCPHRSSPKRYSCHDLENASYFSWRNQYIIWEDIQGATSCTIDYINAFSGGAS